jgi:hypothetical protein
MTSPGRHDPAEIDIEHDAAEVEQQGVGGVGSKRRIHGSRLQNCTDLGNAREFSCGQPGLRPVRKLC